MYISLSTDAWIGAHRVIEVAKGARLVLTQGRKARGTVVLGLNALATFGRSRSGKT